MIDISRPGYFSKSQLDAGCADFYADNGFLVVHDALSAAEIQQLKDETVAVCRQQRGPLALSAKPGAAHAEVPDPEALKDLPDDEVIRRFLCIHQAHKASPALRAYLAHPVIVDVLTRVIGPDLKCMQSMLFIKSAGKPGQAWHQDEDFIPTRDRSLAGAWIAIDDAVVDNGCLWILPGSHRPGILWPMYPHDDPRYDCTSMSYDFPYSDADAVPVEVPAGAIVFFNGYTLHKSEPNRLPDGFRRVLVNHYLSARSPLPWFGPDNLPGPVAQADYRDIVMVAGKDPYAWKGTADIAHPHVRPAGEGGCGDGRVDLDTHKRKLETVEA
jgi:ectoine hydroxylase-related dioxygenase (phytanoyl-CoA dioxygenase family)